MDLLAGRSVQTNEDCRSVSSARRRARFRAALSFTGGEGETAASSAEVGRGGVLGTESSAACGSDVLCIAFETSLATKMGVLFGFTNYLDKKILYFPVWDALSFFARGP